MKKIMIRKDNTLFFYIIFSIFAATNSFTPLFTSLGIREFAHRYLEVPGTLCQKSIKVQQAAWL